jgi:hypothetical protein
MIYNFRFDRYHREEVLRRLQEEKLISQGWGGGEKQDLQVDSEDFVARCRNYYELATTRVPSNLTWMREFKDGDMLVTPHLPENGKVSIHLIDGDFPSCYAYLSGDSTHMNHCIKVKESFGLQGNISIYNSHLIS